ncbi:AAA family ATPase [Polyangium aurulentum]|uniref:AAA family ATPase n=1 Tax=Polyangium aurulentum TaxID=2567896 RepID=UPI0010ADB675|nr:AAA family ATPase [Polyangium aurulentum]UQA62032.1 AAA family ATPase [Polyangium aurulentum]
MVDPIRVEAAANRFRAFFDELHQLFLERDDLLEQLALALLAREHLLVTGPPGTAKSQLASAVFARILDEETGEPSLYARQIGESTVQTDLIGPIDFKTLMQTGRTEYFTDEGMLGAVHAFLDEIFDGRDMLLRSALNVLHERELKQGTRVKRGRVECALMTSNRYIADVLEGARETLLAFVDRIAFVSFVPRGFAEPSRLGLVLRRHIGGTARPLLEATLSIQDLDALQHMVDDVHVSDAICDGLASFLERFDRELNTAVRADQAFVPTRYISTRTAVRSGRVLRAAVIFDRVFRNPKRPLEVLPSDFRALRLHLLLSGPTPDAAEKLLARESDPNERRQLTILRTERSIFERCIAEMPPIKVVPRPAPKPPEPSKAAKADPASVSINIQKKTEPPPPPDKPRVLLDQALTSGDVGRIIAALRELSAMARAGALEAARATELLKEAAAGLQSEVLRRGLAAPEAGGNRSIRDVASDLTRLAAEVDDGSAATRSLARWLRGRALVLVDEAAAHAAGASSSDLLAAFLDDGIEAGQRAFARLDALESLHALRRELLAQGAVHGTGEEKVWQRAIDAAEDDIATLLDTGFRIVVERALKSAPARRLGEVLAAMAPELDRIDVMASRLAALRGAPSSLKAKVAGPRIGALLEAVFSTFDAKDRAAITREITTLVSVLRKSGLGEALAPEGFLRWAAEALLRTEGTPQSPDGVPSYDGYRRLRAAEQRSSVSFTLAEIALVVAKETISAAPSPAEAASAVAMLCARLPDGVRGRVVDADLARIGRALDYLERFWSSLMTLPGDDEARVRTIVESRFFDILWDESALTRFALEARVVVDIFPGHGEAVEVVKKRLDALDESTRAALTDLFRRRSNAAWAVTLRDRPKA